LACHPWGDLQASSLWIDLNSYPEKIDLGNPTQRLQSQNGKKIWQRSFIIGEHFKRIERAEEQLMRVIAKQTV
jgi:hypothetical protein